MLVACLQSPVASAAIPSAAKVRAEMGRANPQAGRAQPLALDVVLTDESGASAATGRPLLEPTGRARLELTFADGRRELHERSPAGYLVTRDGVRVERALPLLPPAQLLQAPTEAEVAAALQLLGGEPERVDLGISGGQDCWVLGGRDPGPFDANRRPSYWFALEARRPVRIDEGDEARFRLGAPVKHESGVFLPAWIVVEAPGRPPWRIDVQRVAPATPEGHR